MLKIKIKVKSFEIWINRVVKWEEVVEFRKRFEKWDFDWSRNKNIKESAKEWMSANISFLE